MRKTKWSLSKCREEASKYENKTDFQRYSSAAYSAAKRYKWLQEVTSTYEILGNSDKRFIYAYEFSDNSAYIGLTYNISKRKINHSKEGTVFKYSIEKGIIPIFKQLIFESVDIEKAKELEQFYLEQYIFKGWVILNKAKTGGLGGNTIKWNYEACKKEALKYETRNKFKVNSKGAYASAAKNGWRTDICSHMKVLRREKTT